jgi:hypothetical protein
MRGKFNHLFVHGRSHFGTNERYYFSNYKLPKINGISIEGIWCPDEFCKNNIMLDTTHWTFKPYFHGDREKANKIGALPAEFKELMGWQVIQGKKKFVRSISFRANQPTHNGSPVMIIYCGEHDLDVYHENNVNWETIPGSNAIEYTKRLTPANEYVAKWMKLFGKNFKIEYPAKNTNAQWEPRFSDLKDYHGTFFERIGGLNYPTKALKTWVPFGCDPFVENSQVRNSYRFYDENLHAHVFIERVEKIKAEDSELIFVTFPSDHKYYLSVRRWTKNSSFIRHKVETVHKDGSVTSTTVYGNEEKQSKSRDWAHSMYRIVNIQKIV